MDKSTLQFFSSLHTTMPRQLPLHTKAAIITLHCFTDKSWINISAALRVHPESARQVFQRAKERAGGTEDPVVILAGLGEKRHFLRSMDGFIDVE